MKGQGKLHKHIIFESVLMLFTQNYQSQSMLDENTAFQSWLVFLDVTQGRVSAVILTDLGMDPPPVLSSF